MNKTGLGLFYGMLAGALWGGIFLAPKLIPAGFTPLQLSTARYLTFGVIALVLIAPKIKRVSAQFGRAEWIALLWLSLVGNLLYYVFISTAVQLSGVAFTSIIIGFLPVAVTIIGSMDHGAVSLKRLWPSLFFGAVGIIGISWQSLMHDGTPMDARKLIGLAAAIGALASWTAFAVGNARWLVRLHAVSADEWNLMTGVVTGGIALVLAVPAFAFGGVAHPASDWMQFTMVAVGLGISASIFGNALWNRMSRLLPLTMVGQMILFETLFALLYGFLWEGRGPTLIESVAIVSVVLSVLLCMQAHRPRKVHG
ncbi:MAG: DMT family transporter [Agrobacterium cavarae]|uniref:DMT family transporter n=1 Tax=Agrobacterium cavarae TaxID=2528239 RepID=A0ABY1Y2N3_9HYPH|nr:MULTISPECIES: DMT family transporter [Agrobacterium]KQR33191.1 multidrug DMT transporter permease [Rhizobium sp. Leaf155]KQZ96937.1 multidrug DMT transporter permease [Rhizobium sp. Root564]MDP9570800.1 drug/metabolite transporter (DMT)-like permease [Agrobacterium larrymoorei]MDD1500974.1 DMT family transporter [Agrobacterium sp. CNPSo 3708]TBN08368.1 DMT family transporter [Agrobacterium cavarae]